MITKETFVQIAKDFGGKNVRVKDCGSSLGFRGYADFDRSQDAQAFAELCRESRYIHNAKPHKNRTIVAFGWM